MDKENLLIFAELLIQKHEVEAEGVALHRAERFNREGDHGNCKAWLHIADTVRDLRLHKPGRSLAESGTISPHFSRGVRHGY